MENTRGGARKWEPPQKIGRHVNVGDVFAINLDSPGSLQQELHAGRRVYKAIREYPSYMLCESLNGHSHYRCFGWFQLKTAVIL